MTSADDEAAVDRVLAGDVSAFEAIVRRWQVPLVNLAYRFCRERSHAEDMAQEAFLRAYRALARWRRDSAFSTWLFALATNLYRTELRRIPSVSSLAELAALREPGAAHIRIEEDERGRAVRRAVQALPARYREAVVLYYFHEMSVPAAAQSLGLPEGTLKTRLARARGLLRRRLAPLAAEPFSEEA